MNLKSYVEALRKRGLEWPDGGPLKGGDLKLRWLPFVSDPEWLTIERWIELTNLLSPEELQAANTPLAPRRQLPTQNFGIRNYRLVDDPAFLYALIKRVRDTLDAVIGTPRPTEIEHVDPDPLMLFLLALGIAEPARIRKCAVCGKIFYAQRKDQKACSRECSNTNRQRTFRQNRPRYEATRKKNRRAEESREEKKMKEIQAAVAKPRFK